MDAILFQPIFQTHYLQVCDCRGRLNHCYPDWEILATIFAWIIKNFLWRRKRLATAASFFARYPRGNASCAFPICYSLRKIPQQAYNKKILEVLFVAAK